MKTFTRRALSTMLASALTATTLWGIAPSTAFADDTVTSGEVAAALNSTESQDGSLVAEPIPSSTDADSAAVAKQGETTIDVAKQPEEGVSITSGDNAEITVSVPNADTAADAKRLADGTVVYPGTDGAATAVIPTESGAQMLTTIANNDAPTQYTYQVDVPQGGRIELIDGSARVLDANGEVALAVPTPWARDAKGTSVPTHFVTDGQTLTQVVDHTAGNYQYPVVADPVWIVGAFVVAFTFVWQHAVRGCGVGWLSSAAYQALVYGWVWREVVRAGRDGCVLGLLGGYRGFVRRW